MKKKLLRTTIQTAAFLLFIYQMIEAILKYKSGPIVNDMTTVKLTPKDAPTMFICNTNQFDYERARLVGYSKVTELLQGIPFANDSISFRGKYNNLTFDDMNLYNYDYSDLKITTGQLKKMFVQPYGFCNKLDNYTSPVRITTKQKVHLFLVDPNLNNDLRIESSEVIGEELTLEPLPGDLFEVKSIEIQQKILDSSLHNGNTCTDYTRIKSSYRECLQNNVKMKFMAYLNCIPPWVPNEKDNVCHQSLIIDEKLKIEYKKLVDNLYKREDLESFVNCRRPCKMTTIQHKKIFYMSNYPKSGVLKLKIGSTILKETEIYSYDIFSLAVELGSALGLWLGLSLLSLYDLATDYYNYLFKVKSYLCDV